MFGLVTITITIIIITVTARPQPVVLCRGLSVVMKLSHNDWSRAERARDQFVRCVSYHHPQAGPMPMPTGPIPTPTLTPGA